MKKHMFTLTNGVRKMCTEEEIDMALCFESQGMRVNGIYTKETGEVIVLFSDGIEREYLPFKMN